MFYREQQTLFASKTGRSIEDISNEMTNQVPMKRFAEAVEIANAISFLASPSASYINGINVPVDGGRTKRKKKKKRGINK